MKSLNVIAYTYREDLDADAMRELTRKFLEVGTASGAIAHYTRLDGRGGFVVQEAPDDPASDFEVTIRYAPWMEFDVIPVTVIEEAFPVIQRVYG